MWKVIPSQRRNWRLQKARKLCLNLGPAVPIQMSLSDTLAVVVYLSLKLKIQDVIWLPCFCIMSFSNFLWSFQIRPQLSKIFFFFYAGTWLPTKDNSDILWWVWWVFWLCAIVFWFVFWVGGELFVACCWVFCLVCVGFFGGFFWWGFFVFLLCFFFFRKPPTTGLHNSS